MTGPRDTETTSYRVEQGEPPVDDLHDAMEDQAPAALNRGGQIDPPGPDKPVSAEADVRGQEESMGRGVVP